MILNRLNKYMKGNLMYTTINNIKLLCAVVIWKDKVAKNSSKTLYIKL